MNGMKDTKISVPTGKVQGMNMDSPRVGAMPGTAIKGFGGGGKGAGLNMDSPVVGTKPGGPIKGFSGSGVKGGKI